RATAQALIDQLVAHPEQDAQLFQQAGGQAKQFFVDKTFTPASTDPGLFAIYALKPGGVVAFSTQGENGGWIVAYVKKRDDSAGQSADAQDNPQAALPLGEQMMYQFSTQAGVTLNPRFGVWEPAIGAVSPSDGESSSISATVHKPNS